MSVGPLTLRWPASTAEWALLRTILAVAVLVGACLWVPYDIVFDASELRIQRPLGWGWLYAPPSPTPAQVIPDWDSSNQSVRLSVARWVVQLTAATIIAAAIIRVRPGRTEGTRDAGRSSRLGRNRE